MVDHKLNISVYSTNDKMQFLLLEHFVMEEKSAYNEGTE